MAELLADFLEKESIAIPHIIGRGILPVKGKMIMFGDPKTNKSYIALNIALALSRGEHIFGAKYNSDTPVLPVNKSYTVLYIEQEIGEDGLRERLKTMIPEPGGIPFYLKTRDMEMRMDTSGGREAIQKEIEQVRPDVLILDPLAKFHLADENSAQHMGAVMRVGDHWIEDYGLAIIYIHHAGKQQAFVSRKGGQRIRGSSAMFGDADALMEVVRKSSPTHKEPTLELGFELRRGEPLESIFIKRLRGGLCEYLGENFHWGRPPTQKSEVNYANL